MLREYVDVRLAAVETGEVQGAMQRSVEIHDALWAQASAAMLADPGSIATGLYVETLNDVIDLHTKRVQAAFPNAHCPIAAFQHALRAFFV